jgi:uncharacterized protein
MILPILYIGTTAEMGRGVFTTEAIAKGTVIEIAPVIIMSNEDRMHLDKTLLHDYIFEWGDNAEQCCMALGYIPIYNHSYESNCEYQMDYDNGLIQIVTMKEIAKEEELFINYNGTWNNTTPIWFEAK